MANLILKDIPDDLHAQLKQEAEANFRNLDQEILARVEASFALERQLDTKRINALIAEAIASGPEQKLTREEFDEARRKAHAAFKGQNRAA